MNLYRVLTGYRSRVTYWSNSKLVKILRKKFSAPAIPFAATMEQWKDIDKTMKTKHPYLNKFEDSLDVIQNILYMPKDVYNNAYAKLHNIFITKTHCLPTKAKLGEYLDLAERMEQALEYALINYVEVQLAKRQRSSERFEGVVETDGDEAAGLKYLDWEISLDDSTQSKDAKVIKELYFYFKYIKNERPDPYDVSGWTEYCDTNDVYREKETPEEKKHIKSMLDKLHEVEVEYDNKDTEMYNKLIDIRHTLWT